jgi:hypothetical protein
MTLVIPLKSASCVSSSFINGLIIMRQTDHFIVRTRIIVSPPAIASLIRQSRSLRQNCLFDLRAMARVF